MALTNHKHDVSTMGMCVRNHTMIVHQSMVHITKHLSECECCTLQLTTLPFSSAHTRGWHQCTRSPNVVCAVLVVVVVVLSSLCNHCLVVV